MFVVSANDTSVIKAGILRILRKQQLIRRKLKLVEREAILLSHTETIFLSGFALRDFAFVPCLPIRIWGVFLRQ